LPGFGDRFLVTLSRTIWSAMAVWDISEAGQRSKVCEWSPRGGIFEGFTVNTQRDSEATLALSIQTDKCVLFPLYPILLIDEQQGKLGQDPAIG